MAMDPNALFSGAPVSITFKGVERGSTTKAPSFNLGLESAAPEFQNAGGPVRNTRATRKVVPTLKVTVNEITAQKLVDAIPGSSTTSSESVGSPVAGLDTTLAADPALGATNLKVASVTTVAEGDFIRVGAAGVAATEANSEVLRVLTVGTTGSGGTGLGVENDAGGGARLDHANAAEVKTVSGSILAAPAVAGDVVVKVDAVSPFTEGDWIRIGYAGHYETRQIATKGTLGPSGTGLTFVTPLTRDHALDEWVVKVTTAGSTTIRPQIGRISDSEYGDFVVVDVGADGAQVVLTIENALCTDVAEITFDDDPANPRAFELTYSGHYDPATPRVVPFTCEIIPAPEA